MTTQTASAASSVGPREIVVGHAEEIPLGEGRAFAVGGRQIAVFRLRGGGWRAVDAVCPHAGGPIADGQADDQVVVCPLHQRVFDLASGALASPPGGGEPALGIRTYPVRVVTDTDETLSIAVTVS